MTDSTSQQSESLGIVPPDGWPPDPFTGRLAQGETYLWLGRPDAVAFGQYYGKVAKWDATTLALRVNAVPFAILLGVFGGMSEGPAAGWALAALVLGIVWPLTARSLAAQKRTAVGSARYAVTNRRALIYVKVAPASFAYASFDLSRVTVKFEQQTANLGSIRFAGPDGQIKMQQDDGLAVERKGYGGATSRYDTTYGARLQGFENGFICLSDAQQALDAIRRAQTFAKESLTPDASNLAEPRAGAPGYDVLDYGSRDSYPGGDQS